MEGTDRGGGEGLGYWQRWWCAGLVEVKEVAVLLSGAEVVGYAEVAFSQLGLGNGLDVWVWCRIEEENDLDL